MRVRCAVCNYRLSRGDKVTQDTELLLCTNCGRAYAQINRDNVTIYKYLGITNGNNEIREILSLEDDHENDK